MSEDQGARPRGRARGRSSFHLGQGRGSLAPQPGDPRLVGLLGGSGVAGQPGDPSPTSPPQQRAQMPVSQPAASSTTESSRSKQVVATDAEEQDRFKLFLNRQDYLVTRPTKEGFKKAGDGGAIIDLVSNYFKVNLIPNKGHEWALNQYRVDFEPDQDNTFIRRFLFRKLKDKLPPYIYDGGHMMFSSGRLEVNPTIFDADYEERTGTTVPHKITIRFIKGLAWDNPAVLQFYNILVRKSLESLRLSLMGRHYFDSMLKIPLPIHKLEIWPGFKTVMRPHENSVLLNVEMVSKVVRTETVLGIINSFHRNASEQEIEKEIVGTIVMTSYNNKTYRVDAIDWKGKITDTFDTKKGPVTFMDYYKNKYARELRDKYQPLLVSKPKQRDLNRGDDKDILLVPELCQPTGLTDRMRSDYKLMSELKNHFLLEPSKKVEQLRTFVQRLVNNTALRTDLEKWNVAYPNNDMVNVKGRQLVGEKIKFNGKDYFDTKNPADWTNAFKSYPMFRTVELKDWAVLVPQREAPKLDLLVRTIQKVSATMNYRVAHPIRKILGGTRENDYVQAIGEVLAQKNGKIDLFFIILPNNQANLYGALKRKCSIGYGIPSQCFLPKNIATPNGQAKMSVCTKVAVQMCTKQGGAPWTLDNPLEKSQLMVVGFDVYHSGGFAEKKKSVGAMVATIDGQLTQYTSVVTMQQKHELSHVMGTELLKLISQYKRINGQFPKRIMFYRDGVGEGQLGQVQEIEISSIMASIKALYTKEEVTLPMFTFIVVSKRINTRFMRCAEASGQPRYYDNPPPGTVVDTVVTLPERFDFFLVSQQTNQGTISPTSYNVIENNSNLNASQLQRFTFKMCHLYYNWSGTVAVPQVCQLAHKLAYLTGLSLNAPVHSNLSNLLHFL